MNMNQFTQKSLAAIQGAQDIAVEHGNQQIEQEHLLLALLSDEQGFIPQLLSAMGMTVPSFQAAVQAHGGEQLGDEALSITHQGQEQVGLLDLGVAVFGGDGLGRLDGGQGFLGQLIHIHNGMHSFPGMVFGMLPV